MLQAMAQASSTIFMGPGVYVVAQRGANRPLDGALVDELRRQPWAQGVSPETYTPTLLQGKEVVVRGIELEGFSAVEDLRVLEGYAPEGDFVLAGARLAQRLGLRVGQPLILAGALEPGVAQVEVTGIVATGRPSEDELMVPLRLGSWLASLGSRGIPVVRVRTSDPAALAAFVERWEAQGGRGGGSTAEGDDRIANLILLDPRLGRLYGRHYVATMAQYGLNTVRLALDGFTCFTVALFALGTAAALGKELEEAGRRIGLLRALGASDLRVALGVVREVAPVAAASNLAGVTLGILLASAMGALGPVLILGHTVAPAVALPQVLAFGGAAVASTLAVTGLLLGLLLKRSPAALMDRRQGEASEEVVV
jgi:ABC-type lipoprotein release transport system permease subunit